MKALTALLILLTFSLSGFAQEEKPTSSEATQDSMTIDIHPKKEPSAKDQKSAKVKKKLAKKKSEASKTVDTTPPKRDSETSLRYLVNGNSRFVKKNFRADGRRPEDREKGLQGENPHSIILASSDSRVVPEIIFDQGLGEIYTVRTIAESIDDSVVASIEYAVSKLNVPLLVVLASSNNAAMKLQAQEDDSDLSDSLKDVLDQIRPRLKTLKRDSPSPSYEVEATLNADAIARELQRKSAVIKSAVDGGKLSIKTALYRISSGRVTFY